MPKILNFLIERISEAHLQIYIHKGSLSIFSLCHLMNIPHIPVDTTLFRYFYKDIILQKQKFILCQKSEGIL